MLYYSTVTELLKSTLLKLMAAKEFKDFRLVGGTALSLQLGHEFLLILICFQIVIMEVSILKQ